ncbi:MAG: hypothetical protein ABJC13_26020 [Acidobacteriota bacterium]
MLPDAAIFQGEHAFPGQLLKNSIEGAAIGLVAERFADVVAIKDLCDALEGGFDIPEELPGGSPPEPLWGWSSLDTSRSLSGRREGRRRIWRGGEWFGRQRQEGEFPIGGGHPYQLESPKLLAAGRFQQLDTGAMLRLNSSLALFVFVACHGRK